MNRSATSTERSRAAVAALVLTAAMAAVAARSPSTRTTSPARREFNEIVALGRRQALRPQLPRRSEDDASPRSSGGPATCSFRPRFRATPSFPTTIVRGRGQDPQEDPEARCAAAPSSRSTVRAGGGASATRCGCSPKKQEFELARGPKGGGEFPIGGKSKAIKGVNKRERPPAVARSAPRSGAIVNGKEVATVDRRRPRSGHRAQGAVRGRHGQERRRRT